MLGLLSFFLASDPWGAVTAVSGAGAFLVIFVGAVVKLIGDRDEKRDAGRNRIERLEAEVEALKAEREVHR